MAVRIAIANHKGGVGKSTSAMIIAEGLAYFRGMRVLVIDLDPQASVSAMLLSATGVDAAAVKGRTLWNLLKELSAGKALQISRFITTRASDLVELRDTKDQRRVDVLASRSELLADYREFEDALRRRYPKLRMDDAIAGLLRSELDAIDRSYDVILFDCPAGAVPLSLGAIRLSHAVIAPTLLDDVSLRALREFIGILLKEDLGVYDQLSAFKVLVTMHVRTNPEQRKLLDHIRAGVYSLNAFNRVIPHSVGMHRAVTRARPDSFRWASEKYGDALEDVRALADEVFTMMMNAARVKA